MSTCHLSFSLYMVLLFCPYPLTLTSLLEFWFVKKIHSRFTAFEVQTDKTTYPPFRKLNKSRMFDSGVTLCGTLWLMSKYQTCSKRICCLRNCKPVRSLPLFYPQIGNLAITGWAIKVRCTFSGRHILKQIALALLVVKQGYNISPLAKITCSGQ